MNETPEKNLWYKWTQRKICKWVTGQVPLGVFVHNYFSVRTIRLAAVSYCGKKVQTVASPVVRSVNNSRDRRNCVQNEPEYAICIIFTTLLYYEALGLILCYLVWQIHHTYTRLDDGHCDVTVRRKMSVLGSVGTMVTTQENFLMMWSFKGPKLFCVL